MQYSWLCIAQNVIYCRSKFYIAGIGFFDIFGSCDLDLDPMTFIYELDPYSMEIYRMCENELAVSTISKIMSERQTDRQTTEIIYHSASRLVKNSPLRRYSNFAEAHALIGGGDYHSPGRTTTPPMLNPSWQILTQLGRAVVAVFAL